MKIKNCCWKHNLILAFAKVPPAPVLAVQYCERAASDTAEQSRG